MLLGHLFRLWVSILMECGRIPNRFIARSQIGCFQEMLPRFFRIAQRVQGKGIIVMCLARLRSGGDSLGKIIFRIIKLAALIGLGSLFGQSDRLRLRTGHTIQPRAQRRARRIRLPMRRPARGSSED